jgi:peroxin-1
VPAHQSNKGNRLESLRKAWILALLEAITSKAGGEVNSLVLGNETLLHIEVKGNQSGIEGKVQESSNGFLAHKNKNPELPVEILFVLTISKESQHG